MKVTKGEDPLTLDTLAAAQAASGQFEKAVATAQAAMKLAKAKGNQPLADAIDGRVKVYQRKERYTSDPDAVTGRYRPIGSQGETKP